MSKQNFYCVIDCGFSKLRFSVFSSDLENIFSETISTKFQLDDPNYFIEIKKLIKNAEKKISAYINDIILTLDTSESFVIDISLSKNFDQNINIDKAYEKLLLELNHLIESNYNNLEILHKIVNKCVVDNKLFLELPKEIKIKKNIKIDFKLICFPKKLINNFKIKFNNNNINILNTFSTSFIKSLNFMRKLNLKKISFLDIGLKRSTFILYENFIPKFIKNIPIGSFHITNDISKIFKISLDEAENIKKLFNKSETEFSYEYNSDTKIISIEKILSKKISIDLLKKVILYRVQEIVDLSFDEFSKISNNLNLQNTDIFLIGSGSRLLNSNSFYLRDKFKFKSIKFYEETDAEICRSALVYYLNNFEIPNINSKKQGLFEKFFNFFSR